MFLCIIGERYEYVTTELDPSPIEVNGNRGVFTPFSEQVSCSICSRNECTVSVLLLHYLTQILLQRCVSSYWHNQTLNM